MSQEQILKMCGERTFFQAAPRFWNKLPLRIRLHHQRQLLRLISRLIFSSMHLICYVMHN